jgi:hypothetical protein
LGKDELLSVELLRVNEGLGIHYHLIILDQIIKTAFTPGMASRAGLVNQ